MDKLLKKSQDHMYYTYGTKSSRDRVNMLNNTYKGVV
jgi:hypothetical protein